MHYVKRPHLTNRAMRLSAARACAYACACVCACDSNKNSFNRTRAGLLFPLSREGNARARTSLHRVQINESDPQPPPCFIIHRCKDWE